MGEPTEYQELVMEYVRRRREAPREPDAYARWREDLERLGRLIDRYHAERPLVPFGEWLLDMQATP